METNRLVHFCIDPIIQQDHHQVMPAGCCSKNVLKHVPRQKECLGSLASDARGKRPSGVEEPSSMRITHSNALSLCPHEWHTTERFFHRLDRSSSLILAHEEEHLVIEKSFEQSTQHNRSPHSCLILHSLVECARWISGQGLRRSRIRYPAFSTVG